MDNVLMQMVFENKRVVNLPILEVIEVLAAVCEEEENYELLQSRRTRVNEDAD